MSASWKLVIVSVALGIAASVLQTLGLMLGPGPFGGIRTAIVMLISLIPTLMWVTRLFSVLIQYKKKGLWFFVGFPIAVLWPLWVFAMWWACAAHWSCF